MELETEAFEELCMDEAVCFIAERHHVTPPHLLRHFLSGERPIQFDDAMQTGIDLEPNETEILKGLFGAITINS